MWRLLGMIVVVCLAAQTPALAAGDALGRAMQAMRGGDWEAAFSAAAPDGQIAEDVITWHYLRQGRGDADQVMDFLARNADWPGLPFLRKKSEATIAEGTDAQITAFFADDLPQTGAGALAWARVQNANGEDGAAAAGIVMAYRSLPMDAEERAGFRDSWADLLKPHHAARLDYALWNGWTNNATALLPLVDDDLRALAEARLALRASAPGVDTLIEAVPAKYRNHPGLAYERFRWRANKRRDADAIDVLLQHSKSAEDLGEPWAWARERRHLTRAQMRAGNFKTAYQIAANHGLVEGSDYADLEWLSGFLALRFLNQPGDALRHFEQFSEAVFTPISLGRAGYWIGRAHEALGNDSAAAEAYAFGAQYQTSFYGLLAAERGGIAADAALSGTEAFPPWREAAFIRSTVFKAAILLFSAGEPDLAERFITHLAESQDRSGMGQLGVMLGEMRQTHVQVMLGKRAAQFGIELPGPYYAVHPDVTKRKHRVPTELVLAIARRESEFDPKVISGAGARGFMQLMPGTAREVSGWLDLPYSADRLLSDPGYNATLGGAYLASLARQFDGNAVMMAAGYNAGPSRPIRWMKDNGDPRNGGADIIDWIELIPFDETRNYVMRVTESLPVYRARLGQPPHPVPFSQELTGSTQNALTQ